MRKAAFFATVVLFMVVLCYLGPKILYSQAADVSCNLVPIMIPFALGPGEAAEFNILPQTKPADVTVQSCEVQVMFYDAFGNEINDDPTCTFPLVRPRGILTCTFEPDDGLPNVRTAYSARAVLTGDDCHPPGTIPAQVFVTVYDQATGATAAGGSIRLVGFGLDNGFDCQGDGCGSSG